MDKIYATINYAEGTLRNGRPIFHSTKERAEYDLTTYPYTLKYKGIIEIDLTKLQSRVNKNQEPYYINGYGWLRPQSKC